MHAETLSIQTEPPRSHWVNVASTLHKISSNNARFLYIGQASETMQLLSVCFSSGSEVPSFLEAKKLLSESTAFTVPFDVIFIDLPLQKSDLETFCLYLKARDILQVTPIIYNESKLDFSNIKLLRSLQLIDDVVNLASDKVDYCNKINFIRKVKSRITGTARLPRTSAYALHAEALRSYTFQQLRRGRKLFSFKRLLDIVLSALAIIILSPVFLLIALCIKITSRGSVFYTSPRAGQGFKIFDFYKFRTMEEDADKKIEALAHLNQYGSAEAGPLFFKVTNDPRITRFGLFLRNTSLDELPQFFNVLKGDMSLVGNRPLPLYEAATLTTNEFVERFMAPAGITGLWQVKKRGKAQMSVEERIKLDIIYARRANIMYDLRIMARTPAALWQKNNV